MATPQELVARADARKKREAVIAAAKKAQTNDNEPRGPDGYLIVDGKPEAYWLPFGAQFDRGEIGNNDDASEDAGRLAAHSRSA